MRRDFGKLSFAPPLPFLALEALWPGNRWIKH